MSAADVFLDTNVLLYLLSPDDARADQAEELIAAGGIISVQVLNEFVAVAARKFKMDLTEIREVLSTVRAVCTVKPVDVETHELGLDLAERYQLPIYDALIVASAQRAGCRLLLTEDMQHGQRVGRLTIRNPFAVKSGG
jgi:predicted nucleic acid-binding protein